MDIYGGNSLEKWEKIHTHMVAILERSFGQAMVSEIIKISKNDFDKSAPRDSLKNTIAKIYTALGEEMTYNLLTNTVLAEVGEEKEFLEECQRLVKEVSQ